MATQRQRRIDHHIFGAVLLTAVLLGCGGQAPGTADPGTGSTGTDVTPPQLISKTPDDGQVAVPIDTRIALTFSEPLNVTRAFLYEPYITLSKAHEGSLLTVQKRSTWVPDSNTMFVAPTTLLEANSQYTVRVDDGLIDASTSSNHLDTGTGEHSIIWRFTTGSTFDGHEPEWHPGKVLRAVPDSYDTVTVCWWNNEPAQSIVGCGDKTTDYQDLNALPPAAFDQPNLDSNGLIYTVQYKRKVDAGFSTKASAPGAHHVTLTGLTASTEYHIRVVLSDLAANQSDVILEAAPVIMPPAGRLYVANQVANGLSMLPDAGQAEGNKAATVVTANETRLVAPTGIAVDRLPDDPTQIDPEGYVYIAEAAMNRIMAYKVRSDVDGNPVEFGQYSEGHNMAPAWTIEGTLTSTDLTELCGPGTLRLERRIVNGVSRKFLYVVNSLALPAGVSRPACLPNKIAVFDVTGPPQSTNQPPITTIDRPGSFFSPIGLAVDEERKLVFIANRDDLNGVGNNGGSTITVYRYLDYLESMDQTPHRTFWAGTSSSCANPASEPAGRICGPTALAYDAEYDRLLVVNRGKNNILVFRDVSLQTTTGLQLPIVVQGEDTGLDEARPVGIHLDPTTRRVYVTTDLGQALLIFDADELAAADLVEGNVLPLRVIKGTKTLLGQEAKDPNAQSRGPYAVTVVTNVGGDEAYLATPGLFGTAGLAPVPTITVFNVTPDGTSPDPTDRLSDRIDNVAPDRALVNPLLGASAVALDSDANRLYVASFHANMIAVYDDPLAFVNGQQAPDRIIGGPSTQLDHPVALLFRPATSEPDRPKSLYVVNQSSHAVSVFTEGDGTDPMLLLGGDVAPSRYLGPPEGTDPFSTGNLTQMVFPTGLAIDVDHDILYVSNRDAETFQDLAGRRIVAFQDASMIDGNVAATWRIEGDKPPLPSQIGSVTNTDKTTLDRPAGLWVIPDPNLNGDDDRLVVANRDGKSVLVFKGVRALVDAAAENPTEPPEDNIAPTWIIKDPLLVAPFGMAFEGVAHTLYVSDLSNRILAFDLDDLVPGTAEPDLTPRVISGVSTGLSAPLGLALDPLN